jgi:hypothetical protein
MEKQVLYTKLVVKCQEQQQAIDEYRLTLRRTALKIARIEVLIARDIPKEAMVGEITEIIESKGRHSDLHTKTWKDDADFYLDIHRTREST